MGPDKDGIMICKESGYRYKEMNGLLECLDIDEYEEFPPAQKVGSKFYDSFKK